MNTHQSPPVRLVRLGMGLAMMLVMLLLTPGCVTSPPQLTLTPTPTPAPSEIPSPSAITDPTSSPTSAAVTGPTDAREAVVRIEVRGAYKFLDEDTGFGGPTEGETGGSGFIIDPSGLAVTNNHIVAGSTIRQVYIADEDTPRRATVIGVAECADLALIDIEGEGFRYFDWSDDAIIVGTGVYAAGYPLNDEEFTLTQGIISKARADGASSWAAVQGELEHTALLNLGSSGGPLFTESGAVVGVNHAARFNASQYLAISATEAQKIIDDIKNKQVTPKPIGLRARAFVWTDRRPGVWENGLAGVWVESVTAGSEAAAAGLQPGDILLKMGGLSLAEDGTLTRYCEILSNREPNGPLDLEVLRPGAAATDVWQELSGQLAGEELAVTGERVPAYAVSDNTETLTVEVPTSWTLVDGVPLPPSDPSGSVTLSVLATTDETDFEQWRAPGIRFMRFPFYREPAEVLTGFDQSGVCTYQGREEYRDNQYSGIKETWTNCGGTNTQVVFLVFAPVTRTYVGAIVLKLVGENDEQIHRMIERSFMVDE